MSRLNHPVQSVMIRKSRITLSFTKAKKSEFQRIRKADMQMMKNIAIESRNKRSSHITGEKMETYPFWFKSMKSIIFPLRFQNKK